LPKGLRTREERRERLEAALGRIEEKKRQAVMKQERKIWSAPIKLDTMEPKPLSACEPT